MFWTKPYPCNPLLQNNLIHSFNSDYLLIRFCHCKSNAHYCSMFAWLFQIIVVNLHILKLNIWKIPPSMQHHWDYNPTSADETGHIHYLMVAFNHSFVLHCMDVFPELRNRFACVTFPTEALKFGAESSRSIRHALSTMSGMDELEKLCAMFRLLPVIFTTKDYTFAGKPIRIEREVRRMQQVSAYVMHTTCTLFHLMTSLPKWAWTVPHSVHGSSVARG